MSGEDLYLYASLIVADFKYEFSDVLLLFVNSIMHLFKKKKKEGFGVEETKLLEHLWEDLIFL